MLTCLLTHLTFAVCLSSPGAPSEENSLRQGRRGDRRFPSREYRNWSPVKGSSRWPFITKQPTGPLGRQHCFGAAMMSLWWGVAKQRALLCRPQPELPAQTCPSYHCLRCLRKYISMYLWYLLGRGVRLPVLPARFHIQGGNHEVLRRTLKQPCLLGERVTVGPSRENCLVHYR